MIQTFMGFMSDVFKLKTVIPLAFSIAANDNKSWGDMKNECRDMFKKEKIFDKIFDLLTIIFE